MADVPDPRSRLVAEAAARRNRRRAASFSLSFLLVGRVLLPDADARAETFYLSVIALGYGHLLGPVVLALRRHPAQVLPQRGFRVARSALAWASLFAVYVLALRWMPEIAFAAFAIGVWHTVENDLVLPRTYANAHRAPPLRRAELRELRALSFTVPALALGAIAVGIGAISVEDFFLTSTLYHLLSWLLIFCDRHAAAPPSERRELSIALAVVHVPPALLVMWLGGFPGAAVEPLRTLVVSPGVYLFWSAAHAVQTVRARRRAGDARAAEHRG